MNREEAGPESALQSQETIYRAILDMIPDGVTQLEGDRVTFISERAREIFGQIRDQLKGEDLRRALFEVVIDRYEELDHMA